MIAGGGFPTELAPVSMRVKMKEYVGVFANKEGGLVSPGMGAEVNVSEEMGKALIDADSAEEVKDAPAKKRGGKAKTGPEETRD